MIGSWEGPAEFKFHSWGVNQIPIHSYQKAGGVCLRGGTFANPEASSYLDTRRQAPRHDLNGRSYRRMCCGSRIIIRRLSRYQNSIFSSCLCKICPCCRLPGQTARAKVVVCATISGSSFEPVTFTTYV